MQVVNLCLVAVITTVLYRAMLEDFRTKERSALYLILSGIGLSLVVFGVAFGSSFDRAAFDLLLLKHFATGTFYICFGYAFILLVVLMLFRKQS